MGKSAIWCGSGCQRLLIGFCLSQVGIGDKTKLTEPKGGGHGLHTYQLSFVAKIAWALKRGEWPRKGVIWGPNMPRNGPISPRNSQISRKDEKRMALEWPRWMGTRNFLVPNWK
jgi:hypothetical protein